MEPSQLLGILQSKLSREPVLQNPRGTLAAVLVITHFHGGWPHVILTKRSGSLKNHAGQVSFPGGTFLDSDKNLLRTAIRETGEEIGLGIDERQVIGSLQMVYTLTSNFTILPFVAMLESHASFKPDEREIEAVLDVPLLELLRSMKPDLEHSGHGELCMFEHGGNVIWGATARILKQVHDILHAGGMI